MIKRVAIQGGRGSFHEQASKLFYKQNISTVCCNTFDDLFTSINEGTSDAAIIAIENTISGGLLSNYSLLHNYNIPVKGEVYLRIEQNLMALPGQSIEQINEVRSHYMAISQTRKFFNNYPHIRLVESVDTAMSAEEISVSKLKGVGAVASKLAAELFDLEILAPGIETYKENFTRFLILDKNIKLEETQINKASLCFTTGHQVGCLSKVLSIFTFYDLNLTKIQSLPMPGKQWQYFFYIDLKFDSYLRYKEALTAVKPLLEQLQVMGEYSSGNQP